MSETSSIGLNFPTPSATVIDPGTAGFTKAWWYVFNKLVARTGGLAGVSSADVEEAAAEAQAAAVEAQAAALAAQAAASSAQDSSILGLMEDDDTAAIALPRINGLAVTMAMSDEPDPVNADSILKAAMALSDTPDPVDADSIVLLSLALQSESP